MGLSGLPVSGWVAQCPRPMWVWGPKVSVSMPAAGILQYQPSPGPWGL